MERELTDWSMAEKEYSGGLYFGVLLKDEKHYKFFASYFTNNEIQIEAAVRLMINQKQYQTKDGYYVLDPGTPHFTETMYILVGIIGAIALIGLIYEGRRRKKFGIVMCSMSVPSAHPTSSSDNVQMTTTGFAG